MDDAFIGEIRIFANSFIPYEWLPCDGSDVLIAQYQALYAIVGTLYGDDSPTGMFRLPDLIGRVIGAPGTLVPSDRSEKIGDVVGVDTVQLHQSHLPVHNHTLEKKTLTGATRKTSGPEAGKSDFGALSTATVNLDAINTLEPNTSLDLRTLDPFGASGAHENRQPFLALYYGICWSGEWPERP